MEARLHGPLTGQQVSGSDRAFEAALTFGPFALGAILSRGGRLLSRVSRLADDIADARFLRKLDDVADFANPKLTRPSLVDDVYNAETGQPRILNQLKCFAPETLIATPEGPRPIGQMRAGDAVLAFDHRTGQWVVDRVAKWHENLYEGPVVTITTESGTVRTTVYHPFWVVAGRDLDERSAPRELADDEDQGFALAGRWVNSHELRPGDVLIGQDGQQQTVRRIEQEFKSNFPVNNLTIDEEHTFAVGPDAVLVHNTTKCDPTAIDQHHLLPVQFKDDFLARGLDPEDFKIPLTAGQHRLRPNGIHTGPYDQSWNGVWDRFLSTNRQAEASEILDQLASMRDQFGI